MIPQSLGTMFANIGVTTVAMDKGFMLAQQKLEGFATKMRRSGITTIAIGIGIALPLIKAIKVFATFDDKMRLVQAVTQETGEVFDMLTERAKFLGRTTSFTARQVADGMGELGRAGFKGENIREAISAILDLARATQTDLGESAIIVASTLRAFELQTSETTRVADVMTAAANNASQTLTDFGESMKYAAPVAAEFGMSLEETAKAISTMANFSIRGSMAGTSLRMIMIRLADKKIQKRLAGIGVSITGSNDELRTVSAILQDVHKNIQTLSKAGQLGFMKDLFGARAISGGLKLAKGNFDLLNKAIDNAGGTARRTAEAMDKGLGGALRIMWSAVEGGDIAIGESLEEPLSRVVKQITKVIGTITEFIERNKWVIRTIAVVGVGLISMGIAMLSTAAIVWTVSKAVGALGTVIRLVGAALAFVAANPIVLAIAAVAALGAAIIHFLGVGDTFMEKIKNIGKAVYTFLKPFIDDVIAAFSLVQKVVSPIFHQLYRTAVSALKMVSEIVGGAVVFWAKAFVSFANWVRGLWHKLWNWMAPFITPILKNVRDNIEGMLDSVEFAFNNWSLIVQHTLASWAHAAVSSFWEVIHQLKNIPTYLRWVADNWAEIFLTMYDFVDTFASNVWKNLSNLWDAIVDLFQGKGWKFEWTGLLEGFESSIKELPKIAAREIGPVEKALAKEMANLERQLSDAWAKQIEKKVQRVVQVAADVIEDQVSALGLDADRIEAEVGKKEPSVKSELPEAVEKGTAEAYSAIVRQEQDTTKKIVKNTGDMVREQRKTNDKLDVLAQPDNVLVMSP